VRLDSLYPHAQTTRWHPLKAGASSCEPSSDAHHDDSRSAAIVFSPLIASNATLALNWALCYFRLFWLINHSYHELYRCSLFACPVFWFHLNLQRLTVRQVPSSPCRAGL
jgi:hypothetical protein